MLLWLLACPPTPEPDSEESSPPSLCPEVVSVWPETGAVDVYPRTNLRFTLSQADESARIVTDLPGYELVEAKGQVHRWILTEALAPLTPYNIVIEGCFGRAENHFVTSDLGAPLQDPELLVGAAYRIDLSAGIAENPATGLLLGQTEDPIWLVVERVEGPALGLSGVGSIVGGTCSLGQQDAIFQGNPYFVTIPGDLEVRPRIEQLQLSGTFTADGSRIEGLHARGRLDVRDISRLLPEYTPEGFCGLLQGFQLSCVPCSDGAVNCVDIEASLIPAERAERRPQPEQPCSSCSALPAPLGLPSIVFGILFGTRRRQHGRSP